MIILDEDNADDKQSKNPSSIASHSELTDPPPEYISNHQPRSPIPRANSVDKPLPRVPPPPQKTSSNNLEIIRSEVCVKGAWTVDTSLPLTRSSTDPSSSSPTMSLTKERQPNLRLVSHQGGVEATVKLKGSPRALLEATSSDGPVLFTIASRERTAFLLKIFATNGDTLVRLPRSFFGPVRCRVRRPEMANGFPEDYPLPIFSQSMHMHLVALSSEEDPESRCDIVPFFLGDLTEQRAPEPEGEWTADEVVVEMDSKSRAQFMWAEEVLDAQPDVSGLFNAMKARLKPLQEAIKTRRDKARSDV